MALTKAAETITDWTAVAQNTVGESGTIDISGHYETSLFIQAFLDSATAHTGTEFLVQISNQASGDEDWADLCRFVELIGTANAEPLTNNPAAAGTTVFTCVSTTGYAVADVPLPWIAIEDATLINSELCLLVAISANTSVTVQDGSKNEHAQNTGMWNIGFAKTISLGLGTGLRARLVVGNTYDSNGSSLNFKVNAVKVTGV